MSDFERTHHIQSDGKCREHPHGCIMSDDGDDAPKKHDDLRRAAHEACGCMECYSPKETHFINERPRMLHEAGIACTGKCTKCWSCGNRHRAIGALADRLEAVTKERDMALAAMSADKADVTLACAVAEYERDDLKRRLEEAAGKLEWSTDQLAGVNEELNFRQTKIDKAEQDRERMRKALIEAKNYLECGLLMDDRVHQALEVLRAALREGEK